MKHEPAPILMLPPAASVAMAANDNVPAIEQAPPIFDVVTGSAADILMLMFGPPQHDNHMIRWRWHQYMKRFPNWTNVEARAIGRELGRKK